MHVNGSIHFFHLNPLKNKNGGRTVYLSVVSFPKPILCLARIDLIEKLIILSVENVMFYEIFSLFSFCISTGKA